MSGDEGRIEQLRRRIQRDPASVAFAGLAEEYRRAGRYAEAIETCSSGLARHPTYLSARVTLARCLIAADDLDGARVELEQVLEAAPENLAALRELADLDRTSGRLEQALTHYRAIQTLGAHDVGLEDIIARLTRQISAAGKRGVGPPDAVAADAAPPRSLAGAAASPEPPPVRALQRMLDAIAARRRQLDR